MTGGLFRIYSGLHLGALFELSEGTWVIGSGDSADIILSDDGIAERHAAFAVDETGVRVTSLDAPVSSADSSRLYESGEVIAPGEPFRLGEVLLVWGPIDADAAFWQSARVSVTAVFAPRVTKDDAKDEPGNTGPALAETSGDAKECPTRAPEGAQPPPNEKDGRAKKGRILSLITLAFALLLSILFFSETVHESVATALRHRERLSLLALYEGLYDNKAASAIRRGFSFGVPPEESVVLPETLQASLTVAGFHGLRVSSAPTGAFCVEGSVRDDNERAKLVEIARELRVPVVLDVTVLSDVTDAYRSAFEALGFYPEVRYAVEGGKASVLVSAYMMTAVEEEKAFRDVEKSIPLRELIPDAATKNFSSELSRKIRYREEMASLVESVFRAEKLSNIEVQYLTGKLIFKTVMTPQQRILVERAVKILTEKSEVPIKIEVVNGEPDQELKPARKKESAASSGRPDFRVIGVSGGTLRFVTLAGGQKVFTGGVLPGGYTLLSIETDKLILQKNGKRITYPLRIKK